MGYNPIEFEMKNQLLSGNNILLELARQGVLRLPRHTNKKIIRLVEKIYPLLAALFSLIAPLLASIPITIVVGGAWLILGPEIPLDLVLYGDNYRLAFTLFASFFPIFILQWAWLRLVEQRPLRSLGLLPTGMFNKYLRGLLVGFLMMIACVGAPMILHLYSIQPGSSDQPGWISLIGIIVALSGWMIQGAAEELLFRGYLLPVISVRYGSLSGIVLSSLVFASLHLFNLNLSILAMVNLFLFGVFASLYALADGSLWGIFAIHSVWNWVQGSLFGLPVSGNKLSGHSLISLTENGPDWVTGGAFGPEGSLLVTFILFISIVLIWILEQHNRG